jgi:copper chaperone
MEDGMETRELHVDGMTCGGCESSVTNALLRVPGVSAVRADHVSGLVTVEGEALLEAALESAVLDAGYDIRA